MLQSLTATKTGKEVMDVLKSPAWDATLRAQFTSFQSRVTLTNCHVYRQWRNQFVSADFGGPQGAELARLYCEALEKHQRLELGGQEKHLDDYRKLSASSDSAVREMAVSLCL